MQQITVQTTVNAPIEKVWEYFNEPEHVMKWNHASDDWHSPRAENDVRTGGAFSFRMESKDGTTGFDFAGTYDEVVPQKLIAYTMGAFDGMNVEAGRKARVTFEEKDGAVTVTETFDPEDVNPIEMQRAGWQAILDNFKAYAEEQ